MYNDVQYIQYVDMYNNVQYIQYVDMYNIFSRSSETSSSERFNANFQEFDTVLIILFLFLKPKFLHC